MPSTLFEGTSRRLPLTVLRGLLPAILLSCGGQLPRAATQAEEVGFARRRAPLRLLVDEYHHAPRTTDSSQGLSIDEEHADRMYVYSPDSTAHPNGLFFLSQAIAAEFRMEPTFVPIDPGLGVRADAFMLVCPEKACAGNPHPVTRADAEHLEGFVRAGGILILVSNSVVDPSRTNLDLEGLNRIADRFGIEFLPTATRTLLIPIARDDPVFFGARGIIYGNGCTIRLHPRPGACAAILLESNNPAVPGPVAVRVRFGRGTVLALGDAGMLGNGNYVRCDVGQPAAVAQLFHCLLPEGPLPAYGWRAGLRLAARMRHELAMSGYPHLMRYAELPMDSAARIRKRMPRQLDRESAATHTAGDDSRQPSPGSTDVFLSARAVWEQEATYEFGAFDGRTFATEIRHPDGARISCRATPRGEFLDASSERTPLDPWRWILLAKAVVAPLDPYSGLGDTWSAPTIVPLPHVQLRQTPRVQSAQGTFRLAERQTHQGRVCLVLCERVTCRLSQMAPQDFVDPEHASGFGEISLQDAEQVVETVTWVDEETRLPVRTLLRSTATLWWADRRHPDSFLSDHDYIVHEWVTRHRRVLVIGRVAEIKWSPG